MNSIEKYVKNVIIEQIYDAFYQYEGELCEKLEIVCKDDIFYFTYYTKEDDNRGENKSYYIDTREIQYRSDSTVLNMLKDKYLMKNIQKMLTTNNPFVLYLYTKYFPSEHYKKKLFSGNVNIDKYKLLKLGDFLVGYQDDIKNELKKLDLTIDQWNRIIKGLEVYLSANNFDEKDIILKSYFIDKADNMNAFNELSTKLFDKKYDTLIQQKDSVTVKKSEIEDIISKLTKPSLLIDKETIINKKQDSLNSFTYVNTLKSIISDNKCLIIGLFGKWGVGKSTIIETLKKDDCNNKYIIYDAWRYNDKSFYRTLILKLKSEKLDYSNYALLSQGFIYLRNKFKQLFYWTLYEDQKQNLKPKNPRTISWLVIFIAIISSILLLASSCTITNSINIATLATLFLGVLSFFSYSKIKESHLNFSNEAFASNFNKIIHKLLKNKKQKINIVIDNLDRCDADTVYHKLSILKTFMGTGKDYDINFIIPLDYNQLKKFIQSNKNYNDYEYSEFISKIFDTSIDIKNYDDITTFKYVESLNMDLSSHAQDLLIALSDNNPRKIKYLYNILKIERDLFFSMYGYEMAVHMEFIIVFLISLKEYCYELYFKIEQEPLLIFQKEIYNNYPKLLDIYNTYIDIDHSSITIATSDIYFYTVNSQAKKFKQIETEFNRYFYGKSYETKESILEHFNNFFNNHNITKDEFLIYQFYKLRLVLDKKTHTKITNGGRQININLEREAIKSIMGYLPHTSLSSSVYFVFKKLKINDCLEKQVKEELIQEFYEIKPNIISSVQNFYSKNDNRFLKAYFKFIYNLYQNNSVEYYNTLLHEFHTELKITHKCKFPKGHVRTKINIKYFILSLDTIDYQKSYIKTVSELISYTYAIHQRSILEYEWLIKHIDNDDQAVVLLSLDMIEKAFQYSTFDELKDFILKDITYIFKKNTEIMHSYTSRKSLTYLDLYKEKRNKVDKSRKCNVFSKDLIIKYHNNKLNNQDTLIVYHIFKKLEHPYFYLHNRDYNAIKNYKKEKCINYTMVIFVNNMIGRYEHHLRFPSCEDLKTNNLFDEQGYQNANYMPYFRNKKKRIDDLINETYNEECGTSKEVYLKNKYLNFIQRFEEKYNQLSNEIVQRYNSYQATNADVEEMYLFFQSVDTSMFDIFIKEYNLLRPYTRHHYVVHGILQDMRNNS